MPHPKTLSLWYKSFKGKPGFTAKCFSLIKQIASKISYIMEQEWPEYVDEETYLEGDDDLALAKDAFVFILVCINGS